ncbi:MAG: LptF/LptG family permease, partial [Bacteroidales bacterium]
MKKIDKLLLKSYIGPLVLTFCIAIFILLMQFIWKYIDELVGKGLDFWIIFKFIFYSCWTFVPMALPLAVLLSSLMLFGNLGEHYELVALKSAGIPLRRAMKPLVFICVGVCCVAFYFANYALPSAYLNFRKVHYEIRTKKPAVNIQEGIYYSDIDGYVIRIGEKTEDGSKLKNIQIYDHSERLGNTRVTMSNWGSMQTTPDGKYLIFNLYDGCSYGEDVTEQASSNRSSSESAAYPFSRIKFDTQVLVFNLNSFQLQSTDENMFSRHQKTLGLKSLQKEIDTLVWKKDMRLMEIIGSLSGRNYYLENFIGRD